MCLCWIRSSVCIYRAEQWEFVTGLRRVSLGVTCWSVSLWLLCVYSSVSSVFLRSLAHACLFVCMYHKPASRQIVVGFQLSLSRRRVCWLMSWIRCLIGSCQIIRQKCRHEILISQPFLAVHGNRRQCLAYSTVRRSYLPSTDVTVINGSIWRVWVDCFDIVANKTDLFPTYSWMSLEINN